MFLYVYRRTTNDNDDDDDDDDVPTTATELFATADQSLFKRVPAVVAPYDNHPLQTTPAQSRQYIRKSAHISDKWGLGTVNN